MESPLGTHAECVGRADGDVAAEQAVGVVGLPDRVDRPGGGQAETLLVFRGVLGERRDRIAGGVRRENSAVGGELTCNGLGGGCVERDAGGLIQSLSVDAVEGPAEAQRIGESTTELAQFDDHHW